MRWIIVTDFRYGLLPCSYEGRTSFSSKEVLLQVLRARLIQPDLKKGNYCVSLLYLGRDRIENFHHLHKSTSTNTSIELITNNSLIHKS